MRQKQVPRSAYPIAQATGSLVRSARDDNLIAGPIGNLDASEKTRVISGQCAGEDLRFDAPLRKPLDDLPCNHRNGTEGISLV